MNKEQMKALQGLYAYCQATLYNAHTFEQREQEIAYRATKLDALGVPWRIQNKVALAGYDPSNLDRYMDDVIREQISKEEF